MEHTSRNNWAAVDTDDGESMNVFFDIGTVQPVAFSTVAFATPQTVSADFYAWFTAAFTKQS